MLKYTVKSLKHQGVFVVFMLVLVEKSSFNFIFSLSCEKFKRATLFSAPILSTKNIEWRDRKRHLIKKKKKKNV